MPRNSLVTSLKNILVLGGGYAGVLAALRIAGKLRREARVTLVNDREHFVERIRLHQVAAGQSLPTKDLRHMLRGTGVELVVARAESVDRAARVVRTEDGSALAYDYLVLALGSGRAKSGVTGAELAFSIGSADAAARVAATLRGLGAGGSVAVMGGGLTAIELASEVAEARRDLAVSIYTAGVIGAGLSEAGRHYVKSTLVDLGVELHEHARVARVFQGGLELEGRGARGADVVVDCTGIAASGLAATWGFAATAQGRLSIDETLRSVSDDRVFGAGDGAAIASSEASFIRMACASAMPLGAHAADNVVRAVRGEALVPFGFAFAGQCISLGRRRGILQYVAPDDTPRERFHSGWLAARLKEAICRYTTTSLAIERMLPGTYTWPARRDPLGSRVVRELTA